jgi:hypothetical protein
VPILSALLAILLGLSAVTPTGDPADEHFYPSRSWGSANQTYGAALVDINGDGRPDPLLGWHNDRPASLLVNKGNLTFARAAVPWNFPMDRHACAWGEANGDGQPDLFCSQGARSGTGIGPKELWSNDPWRDWAEEAGVDNPLARGRSVNWLDYDRDGDLDLFTGAVKRDPYGDQLFRNDRGHFTKVNAGISALRWTQLSTTADWNRDGWPDLLLIQGIDKNTVRAFVNRHGTFDLVRLPHTRGSWKAAAWGDYDGDGWPDLNLVSLGRSIILHNDHRGSFHVVHDTVMVRARASVWLDVNNDGLLDLYVVQSAPGPYAGAVGDVSDRLILQYRPGHFKKVVLSETAGWAGAGQSVAAGDVNGDHRTDVLVSNGRERWFGRQHLLTNRVRGGGGASVYLRGTRWNPLGFGARVRITVGTRVRWTELNDGVSGLSQSSAVVHVSLGSASYAWVRVLWPNGSCDQIRVGRGATRRVTIGSTHC